MLGVFFLAAAPPRSEAITFKNGSELSIQNEYLYTHNRITGSAADSTYLTVGRRFTDNLGLLYNSKPANTNWEIGFDGRMADDQRIEPLRFTLTGFHVSVKNDRMSLTVGDIFASLSPYTLDTSLKGALFTHAFGGNGELTLLTGLDKPNWDDLWGHKESETVDRRYYGIRAAKRFKGEGLFGTSFVWSKDGHAQLNPTTWDTSSFTQDHRVVGLDWALPTFHGLRLYGESAFSKTETDDPASSDDDPFATDISQRGWAHRVKADFRYKRFKAENSFERVSPDFTTIGGSASPDLILIDTRNQLDITGPWKWIVFNYSWFHNNLNRTEDANTSTTRMLETGLLFEAPDFKPDFLMEVKLRHREVTSSFEGLRSRSRSVITSAEDRYGPLRLSVEYEFQHEDESDATASARHHIVGVEGTFLHKFKAGWRLMAATRWNLQRDRDNPTAKTDQTTDITSNLRITSPWGVDAGAGYSRNLALPAADPGSERRTLSASIGYNILKREEHRIEVRFRRNDNQFKTPGQDFKEMFWEISLTNRF